MSRIDRKFEQLKKRKEKAFIAFITAGYPNLKTTEELVLSFDKSGVDIIELGIPFSDPLADGPTIQASSQEALKKGANLDKIFDIVAKIRKKSDIPIAFMSYYNPILHYGEYRFIAKAKKCGVDGIIIPDLPPEEGEELASLANASDISTVFFITPTTTLKRQKQIAKVSTGFIYYISLTGVTGERKSIAKETIGKIKEIKSITTKPVCVGFGVSSKEQVASLSRVADGIIVGSAIIKQINKNLEKAGLVRSVSRYVSRLAKACKK